MTKEKTEAIQEQFKNGEYAVSGHAIIEARKNGIEPHTIAKLEMKQFITMNRNYSASYANSLPNSVW